MNLISTSPDSCKVNEPFGCCIRRRNFSIATRFNELKAISLPMVTMAFTAAYVAARCGSWFGPPPYPPCGDSQFRRKLII
ncbi:hypothetical protein DERF_008895 [Dermatophagoides farinae]|uniref:Uncharacterized protein n=1 Tax=Dermatophagoides farinae TaxID=6954 RepID=A0A922L5X3_DERFA|nr:hypothetical protein DERF_008895 [Dermatophagoides farinae]